LRRTVNLDFGDRGEIPKSWLKQKNLKHRSERQNLLAEPNPFPDLRLFQHFL